MEAIEIEHANVPTPRLYAFLLRVLSAQDPYEDSPIECMEHIVYGASSGQLANVPNAIGNSLALLRDFSELLHFVLEIVVAYDLYESAHNLAEIIKDIDDPELLVAAAAVCSNPNVPQQVRAAVAKHAEGFPPAQVRLDSTTVVGTEPLRRLQLRRWPGLFRASDAQFSVPTVVFDTGFSILSSIRLTGPLLRKGYTVRRFGACDTLPPWFGPQTVVVGKYDNRNDSFLAQQAPSSPYVCVDDEAFDVELLDQALERIWDVRVAAWKPSEQAPRVEATIALAEISRKAEYISTIGSGFGWLTGALRTAHKVDRSMAFVVYSDTLDVIVNSQVIEASVKNRRSPIHDMSALEPTGPRKDDATKPGSLVDSK